MPGGRFVPRISAMGSWESEGRREGGGRDRLFLNRGDFEAEGLLAAAGGDDAEGEGGEAGEGFSRGCPVAPADGRPSAPPMPPASGWPAPSLVKAPSSSVTHIPVVMPLTVEMYFVQV